MKVEPGNMVPLGYGKYFRSESIVGLEPIEEGRAPRKRTRVVHQGHARSRGRVPQRRRDPARHGGNACRVHENPRTLNDIADSIDEINPMLRSIIREQGGWDLDRLEERIRENLREEETD